MSVFHGVHLSTFEYTSNIVVCVFRLLGNLWISSNDLDVILFSTEKNTGVTY